MFDLKQKLKLVDELKAHLDEIDLDDLKALLPKEEPGEGLEGSPKEEASESPAEEALEGDMPEKPKGIAIEKVEVMKKPKEGMPGMSKDDELSDEDLKSLLSKYMK